jgi:hypothetical protein
LASARLRAGLLALLGVALYANSLTNDFVWDDRLTAARPAGLLAIATEGTGAYYRPLVMLSFALDRLLWGASPAGFHVTNVAAHLSAAWLLGALAQHAGLGAGAALASALAFAAHPVQTEAVTYISGRTDVLCALFTLLALLAWRNTRRSADGWAVASAAAVGAALLCKEAAALLPLALLVPGAHPAARPPRPLLPLAAGGVWLVAWSTLSGQTVALAGLGGRLTAIAVALLTYVRLLVWPVGLHLERFTAVPGWSLGSAFVAWALVCVLLAGLAWAARGLRSGWFFLALAALAYLPVSGIVPVYPAIAARALFTAEHFLYLPLLGLAPLVAGAAATRMPRPRARALLAGALAGWGALVVARNRDWRDEATLFRHTLGYDPPAARMWFNAGNLALADGRLDDAERLYRAALVREPGDAAAHLNLGITLQRRGDRVEAEESYRRAIAADARLREAYRALAALLAARGETAEAERLLAQAAVL